jgi:hypothetical protein
LVVKLGHKPGLAQAGKWVDPAQKTQLGATNAIKTPYDSNMSFAVVSGIRRFCHEEDQNKILARA